MGQGIEGKEGHRGLDPLDRDDGARGEVLAMDEGHGHGPEKGGDTRGGDDAHGLGLEGDLTPRRDGVARAERTQGAVHVASAGFEAGHDLLADVAALREAAELLHEARLVQEATLGDLEAPAGKTELHPDDIPSGAPHGHRSGLDERSANSRRGFACDVKDHSARAEVGRRNQPHRMAANARIHAKRSLDLDSREVGEERHGTGAEDAENRRGQGLEANGRCDAVVLERGLQDGEAPLVGFEEDRVAYRDDAQESHDAAPSIEERGPARSTWHQTGDVVRDHALEEPASGRVP